MLYDLTEVLAVCEDKLNYIVAAHKNLSVLTFNNPTDPIVQTINSSINPIIYNLKKLSCTQTPFYKTFYLYEDYTYNQKIFNLNQVLEGVIFFLKRYVNFNPFQKVLNSKKYAITFLTFINDLDCKSKDLLLDIPIVKFSTTNNEIVEWSYTIGSQLQFNNESNKLKLIISKNLDNSDVTLSNYQTEILSACSEDCYGKCEYCFVQTLTEEETRFYLSIVNPDDKFMLEYDSKVNKEHLIEDELDITLTDLNISG